MSNPPSVPPGAAAQDFPPATAWEDFYTAREHFLRALLQRTFPGNHDAEAGDAPDACPPSI